MSDNEIIGRNVLDSIAPGVRTLSKEMIAAQKRRNI